ncbi:NAD-dependent epimerase/dehydratase family protein (plasmid) [Sinorhizobium meliloti]|nr:NAD-dependent epimerase/dehydratase family protein [Sinorhizobium meliloti]
MRVLVTGGTGHIGSYIIHELIAAGHEVIGLPGRTRPRLRCRRSAPRYDAGISLTSTGSRPRRRTESDGVIHVAHRQDLLPSGGIDAVAAAEFQIMLAYGEALAGTGKPLVVSGSIGSPGWERLGRPATEEDPALPGGDAYKGTLRVRNAVELAVIGLAGRGVRSSVVRIPPIAHSTTDAGFLQLLIGLAREKGVIGYPGDGANLWPAVHARDLASLFRWRLRRGRLANIGTGLRATASGSARSPRLWAAVWACPPCPYPRTS